MSEVYKYVETKDYDKKIEMEPSYWLSYYSKKCIRDNYPNGGFIVVAGIGKGLHKELKPLLTSKKTIMSYTLEFNSFLYAIDGYIDIGNNQYIALVKSRLKRNIIFFVCILIIIGSLIYGGLQFIQKDEMDTSAKDYTPPNGMNVVSESDHIAIPAYDELIMKANTDTIYVSLWNPETNPCNFKFKIILQETDEVLYQSDLVAPGKAIKEVVLNKKIKAGIYPITILVESKALNGEDIKYNNGSIETTINAMK